jgi:hypothetical protein
MKPTIHFRFLFLLEMEETKKFDTWSYLEVWNRPDGPTHPGPDGPIHPGPDGPTRLRPDRNRGPDRGPYHVLPRSGPTVGRSSLHPEMDRADPSCADPWTVNRTGPDRPPTRPTVINKFIFHLLLFFIIFWNIIFQLLLFSEILFNNYFLK